MKEPHEIPTAEFDRKVVELRFLITKLLKDQGFEPTGIEVSSRQDYTTSTVRIEAQAYMPFAEIPRRPGTSYVHPLCYTGTESLYVVYKQPADYSFAGPRVHVLRRFRPDTENQPRGPEMVGDAGSIATWLELHGQRIGRKLEAVELDPREDPVIASVWR